MVSRSRLKSLLTGLALYTMAAAMVGYFGVNAYTGKYGLNARQELDQEILNKDAREQFLFVLGALVEGQTYAAPLHITFRLKDGDEVREEDARDRLMARMGREPQHCRFCGRRFYVLQNSEISRPALDNAPDTYLYGL